MKISTNTKSNNSKTPGRGPIARKVIASAKNSFEKKVTNLSDWREGKMKAADYQKTVISTNKLSEFDPLHGLYIYAQNQLSVIIELLCELPMLDKLSDAYAQANDEYMPSGPPMSPLTLSYFFCWGAFDLCSGGQKKETLGTVAVDLCEFLNVDEGLISLFDNMQASRMGIYKHEGTLGHHVLLRELITNKQFKVYSASGYSGNSGEIWYARIFPPPFDNNQLDYSVSFTTPYVLGKNGSRNEFIPFVESDWLEYFERTLSRTKIDDKILAYEYLMKYGLGKNYWNEYVFLSYRNFKHDMILLEGFPDIPSSLPHAKLKKY